MEFHVSRAARDRYQFDQLLFSSCGNVIFANFQAARQFAKQINDIRLADSFGEPGISAGQINALGMIDEIFHMVTEKYYEDYGVPIRHALYKDLAEKLGEARLEATIFKFAQLFPSVTVYQGNQDVASYLEGSTNGIPNLEIELEELLMLWLTNVNPAATPYQELFNDTELEKTTAYSQVIDGISVFFKKQPSFGPENQDLVTMLRTPAIVVPQSLSGQLDYIRQNWATLIGDKLLKLLGSLDMIKEENKVFFAGPGPSKVPDYSDDTFGGQHEVERFSPDSDWMPNVIMLAKNSFVWLNQLSRQYQRQIERLDQIPDETLDELARWGFTGLWLIGLWERSDASRRIKQLCGNPDAVSSAYSLARYSIAERLGGESAYYNLSQRCGQRGIRLASDMVPNHMGIDSDWVYDHPDWFVQRDQSPFPGYTFSDPNLSTNPRVSINLEDHYYTRSDAAVVFKRYDHNTGRTAYIYHGNDGTSMPWNDTAQLNYLNPEVREAVIQTILDVARKFPIIRFDAAMTLTKKHYQRLWFPQPGTGGDIPSRADSAMTKADFDAAMPEEFWREVVERVAKEVPDTLLLAEAFWLMEGYFVRTLGMHRVYNSAFMHMMRNEENEKYRLLIKNTLVYDPQILKRYVNFMNNPDEKTAVEQFGKGDKYFGICAVMATMPGLPMFGHGQVEGFSEKYGMEYYRPYWDESPDQELIRQHQRVIFPILHRRRIFADVENFTFYDFYNPGGWVDENVFAYSNYKDGQAALVLYHNKYGSTSGWIHTSVPFLRKSGAENSLRQRSLFEALQLNGGPNDFLLFRDEVSKLTFIRSLQELKDRGLYFDLGAYSHQVLLDFWVVSGADYAAIYAELGGRGVDNFDNVRRDMILRPVIEPLRQLLERERLVNLVTDDLNSENSGWAEASELLERIHTEARNIYRFNDSSHFNLSVTAKSKLTYAANPIKLTRDFGLSAFKSANAWATEREAAGQSDPRIVSFMTVWALLSDLGGDSNLPECQENTRQILSEPAIISVLNHRFQQFGFSDYEAYKNTQLLKVLVGHSDWMSEDQSHPLEIFEGLIADHETCNYLEVNEYNQVLWFNQEMLNKALIYLQATGLTQLATQGQISASELSKLFLETKSVISAIHAAADKSEYQIAKLKSLLM
ncbi:MAG: alpha-amylase family glycosyl hydrolase [Anaerolineaceae bacterium]